MRRPVFVPLALCVFVSLAAGTAWTQDLDAIRARGTLLVVAVVDEQPEMFSFDPRGNPGFEREMLEGFARLQRLKLEVVQADSFDKRIPILLDGTADVGIGMVVTAERREKIDFTHEVLPVRHLVVTRKPRRVVETVAQFLEEKIGVLKGTTWAKTAYEAGAPRETTREYADMDALLGALADGSITATVMTVSDFTLAAKRVPELQGGAFLGPAGSAAWGIRKDADQLQAAIDQYLDNFRRGPSWSRLVVKYFGEQALSVLGRAGQ